MQSAKHLLLVSLCIVLRCAAAPIAAQEPAGPAFTLKQLGPNTWAAIDNRDPNASAGSNAGVVIGDDGVAVIDSFVSVEAAKQLIAQIEKLTKLPVRFVVNTHYHADHVVGNRVFMDAGAVVLAHRNVRAWIHSENAKLLPKDARPELKALIEGLVAPTLLYDQGVDLYLGSRQVQVRSFPGHTGGDSVVFVPDAKVAFCGDLLWQGSLPNTIDASTAPWIATLDTLAKESSYTFVPGHGDVAKAQDVTAFQQYLATLRKLVADAQAQGKSGTTVVEAVMPALTEKYGQWDFFKYLAERNIQEIDAELKGTKRIPKAP